MSLDQQYGVLRTMGKTIAVVFGLAGSVSAGEVTVMALGDSLTQGYGLAQGDGFVPQLEGWLRSQGAEVRVLNAGVSGDTTAGGLARVAWSLTPEVDAMIVALGGNDMLRGIDPGSAKDNLAGILEVAQSQDVDVLLVGMRAPGNFGPDYKAAFDAMYPALSTQYDTLYAESFLEGLGSVDPSEVQSLMQGDGIHPNKQGMALIVDALGPHVMQLIQKASAE